MMNKSILVRDTPESCSKCFKDNKYNLLCNKTLTRYDIDIFMNKRHPECPLQGTTELLEDFKMTTDLLAQISYHGLVESPGYCKDVVKVVKDFVKNDCPKINKALGGNDE